MAPGTARAVIEATNDALGETIGEIFDIPEMNLDGQMVEMVSGDDSYQEKDYSLSDYPAGTNATAHDDAGDQAVIDLVPVPSESHSTTTDTFDPLDGIFG